MRTTISATAAAAAFVAATAWAPSASAAQSHPQDPRASAAVEALTGTAVVSEAVLADLTTMVGYRPAIVAGIATNPHGDCSSPVPLPAEFEPLCRAHDLGYDLLRYADHVGEPLGGWARRAIDDQLDRRMAEACDTRADALARGRCHVMAVIAANVVDANSFRQGDGVPVPESPWGYVVTAVGLLIGALTLRSGAR